MARSLAQRLQSIPKPALYLALIVAAAAPLFAKVEVPNEPVPESRAFYDNLMALKPGDRVLIASDWTNSTRGESKGEFEALLRILLRKRVKFAVYTNSDPQGPQVARNTIRNIVAQETAAGRPATPFEDYVVTGFFPNAEGTLLGINSDVRAVFADRKDLPPGRDPQSVLTSPVFQGIQSVADFRYLIVVTGVKTSEATVERVKNTSLMFMVTGVMAPETRNYYASGQILGLVGGVKGVFDLETMMAQGFPGMQNEGQGTKYYLSLHSSIGLLILAVVIGNVAMLLSRRKA